MVENFRGDRGARIVEMTLFSVLSLALERKEIHIFNSLLGMALLSI